MLTIGQQLLQILQNSRLILFDQFCRKFSQNFQKGQVPRARLILKSLQGKIDAAHVQITNRLTRTQGIKSKSKRKSTSKFLVIF